MGSAAHHYGSIHTLLDYVKRAPQYPRDDGINCTRCNCLHSLMCFQVEESALCASCYGGGGTLYSLESDVKRVTRFQSALRWYATGTAPWSIGDYEGDAASIPPPSVFQGVCVSYPSVSSATVAKQIDLLDEREGVAQRVAAKAATGDAIVKAVGCAAPLGKKRKNLPLAYMSATSDQLGGMGGGGSLPPPPGGEGQLGDVGGSGTLLPSWC